MRAKRLGIEICKIEEGKYVSSGCEQCNPISIMEWCANCNRIYLRDFKNNVWDEVNVSFEELKSFLKQKDEENSIEE